MTIKLFTLEGTDLPPHVGELQKASSVQSHGVAPRLVTFFFAVAMVEVIESTA